MHVEAGAGPLEKFATYSSAFRRRAGGVESKPPWCGVSFGTSVKSAFWRSCQESHGGLGTLAEASVEAFHPRAA